MNDMLLLMAPVVDEVAEETETETEKVTWEKLLEEPEVEEEVDEDEEEEDEEEEDEESLMAAASDLDELYGMLTEDQQSAAIDPTPGESHKPCGCGW